MVVTTSPIAEANGEGLLYEEKIDASEKVRKRLVATNCVLVGVTTEDRKVKIVQEAHSRAESPLNLHFIRVIVGEDKALEPGCCNYRL